MISVGCSVGISWAVFWEGKGGVGCMVVVGRVREVRGACLPVLEGGCDIQ